MTPERKAILRGYYQNEGGHVIEALDALDAAEARADKAEKWEVAERARRTVAESTLSTLIHALRRKCEPNSLAAGEPPDMETVFSWLGVRQ